MLSRKLGLSLGSVNYVLSNLVDAGYIRAKRFKNSKNKIAYIYILTPAGIKSRMQLSRDFLKRKLDEYEINLLDYWRVLVKRKLPDPPPDVLIHSTHSGGFRVGQTSQLSGGWGALNGNIGWI